MSGGPRLDRIAFTTPDLDGARRFYRGLGFVETGEVAASAKELLDLGLAKSRARRLSMRLGRQNVEFLAFDPPGRPYPPLSSSTDLWFQHVAVVVADMNEAFRRVSTLPGMTPISRGGPRRLPPDTGGVTAFKFRDPDGHPLELIAFPPGVGDPAWQVRGGPSPFLGLDHSAISVGDLDRSRAFYEALGFRMSSHSVNHGVAQQHLDDVDADVVDVMALALGPEPPHLELLAYRTGTRRPIAPDRRPDNVAATRLVIADVSLDRGLRDDPDGHLIAIEG